MDTSKSLRSTPKHRPLKVLSAVRNGARSAPYAYNGRYERHVAGDMATTSAVRRNIYQQDPMPFTLVERVHSRKVKYRIPNKDEIALLRTTFPTAVTFRFEFPLIIVHCSRAPEQIPLTIGKVAAIFLAETDVYHPIPAQENSVTHVTRTGWSTIHMMPKSNAKPSFAHAYWPHSRITAFRPYRSRFISAH